LRTFGGADGILTLEEILLHLERVDPEPRTGELYGNEPGSSFLLVAGPIVEDAAPEFGSLIVHVSPRNADVIVLGGPPPAQSLLKTLRVQEQTSERRFRLPQGQYQVRATLAGFHAKSKDVQLTAQGQAVELLLERIEVRSDPVRPMAARVAAEPRIVSLPDGGGNMTFVWIPSGSFTMGNDEGADYDRPEHNVTLDGFWMGAYEVTNAQFEAFTRATGYETTTEVDGVGLLLTEEGWETKPGVSWRTFSVDGPNHPVQSISWIDAMEFCRWAGTRLPTEAQWEYSAQGGQQLDWATPTGEFGWGQTEAFWGSRVEVSSTAQPVDAYPPNPWGVYSMSGNVPEWCLDIFSRTFYSTRPATTRNPYNGRPVDYLLANLDTLASTERVIRGGGWGNNEGQSLRSTARNSHTAGAASAPHLSPGFRCVLAR
jgi:formylglycine-generating enzyme required for sulfatase activity